MSQSQCGGSSSQTRYRSSPWWAFTPPTSLIGHRPLREREARRSPALLFRVHAVLASLSAGYPPLPGTFRCITHPFATRRHPEGPAAVRLACVRHAASVQSEPGSNSQVQSKNLARILRCACQRSTPRQHPHRSAVPKFLKNLPFPPHRLSSAAEPALFLTPLPLSTPPNILYLTEGAASAAGRRIIGSHATRRKPPCGFLQLRNCPRSDSSSPRTCCTRVRNCSRAALAAASTRCSSPSR